MAVKDRKNGFFGWLQAFCLLAFFLGIAACSIGFWIIGVATCFISGCLNLLCYAQMSWLEEKDREGCS